LPIPALAAIPTPEPVSLGQVTPRLVDTMARTVPWMRAAAAAGLAWVCMAAVLLLSVLLPQVKGRLFVRSPAGAVFWGIVASVVFVAVAIVFVVRFASACDRLTERHRNRTAALESAFSSALWFWRWAGAFTAALLVLRLFFLVGDRAGHEGLPAASPQEKAAAVTPAGPPVDALGNLRPAVPKDPKEAGQAGRQPAWTRPADEISAPGRILKIADVPKDCALEATSFLCVLNRAGEPVGEGSRWVVRQGVRLTIDESGVGEGKRMMADLSAPGWDVRVAPPQGFPFARTLFANTTLDPEEPSRPVLSIALTGCRETTQGGQFRIVEVDLDPASGEPNRLVVDFETLCESGAPVVGRIAAVKE
jgi:hypothetical protein